ncbi:MAG: FAD-dependent oxidoreductase [Gammaproteobacteria bacterium]|nr:FAD-dependent oxidoreductase [Gammaproteobacteria bacterium]
MKRIIIFLVIAASIIFSVTYFDAGNYLTFNELKERQSELQLLVNNKPFTAAAIFFSIYVIATGVSVPGAFIFTLAGGALFGLTQGTILVSFASTIGALLAYLVARYFLHDFIQNKFSDRLELINRKVEKDGAFYLLFLRLVPAFPFFLVNLAMALTPIRAFTFYWVSQLGMFPATLVYVNAGTQIAKISSPSDIASPSLIFALILLAILPFITKGIMSILKSRRVYKKFKRPHSFEYNTVVLGGGSAGLVAAYTTSTLQGKVALIERHQMGGDCLNTGCVPSKSILRSAKFIADIKDFSSYGLSMANYEFEFKNIMARVHNKISVIEPKDSVSRYTELGVHCEQGNATVLSPWQVKVNDKILTTKNIIISTGATPALPHITDLDRIPYLTTDTVWSLTELPKKLLVIGAGPIGCELGQAFARLGSDVTIVHKHSTILPNEEEQASKLVETSLLKDNVTLLTNFISDKFINDYDNYSLVGSQDNGIRTISFTHLLIATGRKANLDGLDLLDLEINKQGRLVTNDTLQTKYSNIYACGDVTSPMQYTHTASHQAWYAAFNALFHPIKKFKCTLNNIPRAVFTDPEITSVGITEKQAIKQGIDYQVTTFPMDDIDRAITDNATTGFIKVITPINSDKILGVCIVGEHASELIAEFVLAKTNGLGLNKILKTVHIYPTRSEINRMVAGKWRRSKLTARTIGLLKKFQAWRLG